MNLIQCASNCIFQKDGYCELESISFVNSVNKSCPHFKEKSADNTNGFFKISNTDKLY